MKALLEIFWCEMWFQNYSYSSPWDKWINNAMDDPHFEYVDGSYHVNINGVKVWIANRPYAFHICDHDARPSRRTIRRFYRLYDEWMLNRNMEGESK